MAITNKDSSHDEVGHYETKIIQNSYDEPIYEEQFVYKWCNKAFEGDDEVVVENWGVHSRKEEHWNYEVKPV